MLADAPRSDVSDKPDGPENDSKVTYRELKSKDDIKNYIKGII